MLEIQRDFTECNEVNLIEFKDVAENKDWELWIAKNMQATRMPEDALDYFTLQSKLRESYIKSCADPHLTAHITRVEYSSYATFYRIIEILNTLTDKDHKNYLKSNYVNYKNILVPKSSEFNACKYIVDPSIFFAQFIFFEYKNITSIAYEVFQSNDDNDDLILHLEAAHNRSVSSLFEELEETANFLEFLKSKKLILETIEALQVYTYTSVHTLKTLLDFDPLFVWFNMLTNFKPKLVSIKQTCKLLEIPKPTKKYTEIETWIEKTLLPALKERRTLLFLDLINLANEKLINL